MRVTKKRKRLKHKKRGERMESDLPVPIDDSVTYQRHPSIREEEQEEYYYHQPPPPPMYMMQQPPPQPPPVQKKDMFSELDRIHWIIFIATALLAFFMGKSISTPIILRTS
jgi:hypothetical protein